MISCVSLGSPSPKNGRDNGGSGGNEDARLLFSDDEADVGVDGGVDAEVGVDGGDAGVALTSCKEVGPIVITSVA